MVFPIGHECQGRNPFVVVVEMCGCVDKIENFLSAHRLSRRARAIIRQNLTISLGVVVVMVIATVLGFVPLAVGVAAHEGSTVLVCLNSLRLLLSRNR